MKRSFPLLMIVAFIVLAGLGIWASRLQLGTNRNEDVSATPPPPPKRSPFERSAGVQFLPAPSADAGSPAEPRAPSATGDAALERAIATATRPGEDRPRGTAPRALIVSAIQSVKPLMDECFGDAKNRYPPPQKVVLRFTIEGGELKDGEIVESTLPDPWLESCFLDSLLDARLPEPSGEEAITVTYDFQFGGAFPDAGMR